MFADPQFQLNMKLCSLCTCGSMILDLTILRDDYPDGVVIVKSESVC